MSQSDFAASVGTSQAMISRMEKGDVMPDLLLMRRIAEGCGMTRKQLTDMHDEALSHTLKQGGIEGEGTAAQTNAFAKLALLGVGALAAAAILVHMKNKK